MVNLVEINYTTIIRFIDHTYRNVVDGNDAFYNAAFYLAHLAAGVYDKELQQSEYWRKHLLLLFLEYFLQNIPDHPCRLHLYESYKFKQVTPEERERIYEYCACHEEAETVLELMADYFRDS